MPNSFFQFKQFTIYQDRAAMKVTTDGCLFGAWCAERIAVLQAMPRNILDIGTGTGLLSLMLAQKTEVPIDAVEIEAGAAIQARENFASSPWKHRLRLIHEDVRKIRPSIKYDCIISNPPFYESELASPKMERNLAHHSTELSMDALIQAASDLLQPAGHFFLLLPFKRVDALLPDICKNWHIVQRLDVYPSRSHPPFRVLLHLTKDEPSKTMKETLFIRDEQQQYTPAFVHLLRDYYLYL